MIRTGEKLSVELPDLPAPVLREIQAIDGVRQVSYQNGQLVAHCMMGGHQMIAVLDLLRQRQLPFGRVFSEPPTLNDVFLEITGKQLRD